MHRGEDGGIQHAELALGGGIVMFGAHDEGGWMGGEPPRALASTISIYDVVCGSRRPLRAGEGGGGADRAGAR